MFTGLILAFSWLCTCVAGVAFLIAYVQGASRKERITKLAQFAAWIRANESEAFKEFFANASPSDCAALKQELTELDAAALAAVEDQKR
ncbi:hypothetical protein KBA73_00690 [Patescibacteria group bacterium]|nr:hypothetical protein [Patescibacteria group bacterium]